VQTDPKNASVGWLVSALFTLEIGWQPKPLHLVDMVPYGEGRSVGLEQF
jgi:hypothetical protein